MKSRLLLPLFLLLLPSAATAQDSAAPQRQFVTVSIDRVNIETEGLTRASVKLAESVDKLALALQQLSTNSEALSEADKQVLLDAVRSVDQASAALARLANELPQTAEQLRQQLPRIIENARQPIADLSSGLQSARDGIYAITESLPQATDSAKILVDSALDSALVKISTYTVILIAVLALALIGVVWFIYRQYLAPIAARLEPLAIAPEHFAELSRYMKETSDNLLSLQARAETASAPGLETDAVEPESDSSPAAIDQSSIQEAAEKSTRSD